jgi:hypothetical protein
MSGRYGRRAMAQDMAHDGIAEKLSQMTQKLQPYMRRDAFATRMGITAVPRSLVSAVQEIEQLSYAPNSKALMKVNSCAKRLLRAAEFDDRDAIPRLIGELTFSVGDVYASEVNHTGNQARTAFGQLERINAQKQANWEKEQKAAQQRLSQIPTRGFGR